MLSRRTLFSRLSFVFVLVLTLAHPLLAQDDNAYRGRKYKAPPPTSRVEVVVRKHFNGKPIPNAAVIFDSFLNGKEEGNLEVKTDPDGKATIDVITTGSTVRVQVIATGFATFAEEYLVDGAMKSIDVAMLRPQEQLSSYQDNSGKAATRKPGVQEPIRPTTPASSSTPPPASTTPPPSTVAPKQ